MGLQNTLLGIDVVRDQQLVAQDVNEQGILDLIRRPTSKDRGHSHWQPRLCFWTGNQQISAEVIKQVGKENILIVATRNKLDALKGRPLLVDTRSRGQLLLNYYIRVITTYNSEVAAKIKGLT